MNDPEGSAARLVEVARERRMGVRAAREDLEHTVAAPSTGRADEWGAAIESRLKRLQSAWENHVAATEAPGGLFEEIITQAPRLAHRVSQLRAEHVVIRDGIGRSLAVLSAGPLKDEGVPVVCEAVFDLLARTARHRHEGADTVYEAFNVDIEAAD